MYLISIQIIVAIFEVDVLARVCWCISSSPSYAILRHQYAMLASSPGSFYRRRFSHISTRRASAFVTGKCHLRCVYTLRFVGPISYLGACYIRTKVTKYIREHMTMYYRGLTIKSHSSGYEIGPTNRSV